MKKASIRALRRIISNDFQHYPMTTEAECREEEFRKLYMVPNCTEWNARAKKLKEEYIEYLTNFNSHVTQAGISKADESNSCMQGDIVLKVKGHQYGTKLDLLRVYVYGLPREFRRLIKDKKVHKKEWFEKVSYEIDITTEDKTSRACLLLHEGHYVSPDCGAPAYYIKGTVVKLEATWNGRTIYYQRELNPPEHIPPEQEYLWMMKYLSDEKNFIYNVSKLNKSNIKCCNLRLDGYGAKVSFCPQCGRDVRDLHKKVVFANFRVTFLTSIFQFSGSVLELEDAPYSYVTTKRMRKSNVPIF